MAQSIGTNLMRSAEVADFLGVDVSTLAAWARDGRITPAIKLPGIRGARLFERADVERLAKELRSS